MHRAKGDRFVRASELPVCNNYENSLKTADLSKFIAGLWGLSFGTFPLTFINSHSEVNDPGPVGPLFSMLGRFPVFWVRVNKVS